MQALILKTEIFYSFPVDTPRTLPNDFYKISKNKRKNVCIFHYYLQEFDETFKSVITYDHYISVSNKFTGMRKVLPNSDD